MSKSRKIILENSWQFCDGVSFPCYDAVAEMQVEEEHPDDGYLHIYQNGKDVEEDECELLNLSRDDTTQLVRLVLSNGFVDLDDVLLGKPND